MQLVQPAASAPTLEEPLPGAARELQSPDARLDAEPASLPLASAPDYGRPSQLRERETGVRHSRWQSISCHYLVAKRLVSLPLKFAAQHISNTLILDKPGKDALKIWQLKQSTEAVNSEAEQEKRVFS